MGRVGQIVSVGLILCGLLAPAAARADDTDVWPPVPTTAAVNVPAVWQVQAPGAQIQPPPPPAAGPPAPAGGASPVSRTPPVPGIFFDPALTPAGFQQPFLSAQGSAGEPGPNQPAGQPLPAESGPVMISDADGPVILPGSGLPYQPGLVPSRNVRLCQPYVMLETVFLAPVQNVGGSSANYTFDNGSSTYSANTKAVNGMIVTPRISLGLMGNRWGVGVRFWTFNNDQGSESFPTITSQGVFSQSLLKMQTLDLEAIRRIEFNNSKLWLSFGARYGSFVHTSTISSNDYMSNSLYSGAASSGAGFHGVGPTLALNGLFPMGNSNWNWFYGGRVSWLWDTIATTFAQTDNSFVSNSTANGGSYYATNVGSGNAFIGELQLGAQYNHTLQFIPVTAFLRIAGEYQYWHVNYGGNSFSNSSAASTGSTSVASIAGTSNSNLGTLGLTVSTGFMW